MNNIEIYFIIFLAIQLIHSIEKLYSKFWLAFPFFKMSRTFLIVFDILFFGFSIFVLFSNALPDRNIFINLIILLIFLNGAWEVVWGALSKKYVPGLYAAPAMVILFLLYYFSLSIK